MAVLRTLAAAMAVVAFFEVALCVNYDVGGPAGAWDLSTNYTHWVSGKTFRLGDTLTFTYPPAAHDVLEVDSTGYSACNAGSSTFRSATGNTVVRLTTTGKRYFICGVATHCSQGMQLEIDVVGAIGKASPPSNSPPPPSPVSASASASPAQAPASSTPPPPPPPLPSPPNAAVPGSITGEAKVTLGLGLATIMMALGL